MSDDRRARPPRPASPGAGHRGEGRRTGHRLPDTARHGAGGSGHRRDGLDGGPDGEHRGPAAGADHRRGFAASILAAAFGVRPAVGPALAFRDPLIRTFGARLAGAVRGDAIERAVRQLDARADSHAVAPPVPDAYAEAFDAYAEAFDRAYAEAFDHAYTEALIAAANSHPDAFPDPDTDATA